MREKVKGWQLGSAGMKWIAAILVLGFAAPANAKPVYLRCTVNGATSNFDITLDEDRGTAVTFDQTVPAIFTVDEVTFRAIVARVVSVKQTINRKTLEFTTESYVSGGSENKKRGTCEIATAPQNKF